MTDREESAEEILQRVVEIREHYQKKKRQAIHDHDETGAAYHSGQVSGLIAAEEAIKDDW